MQHPQIDRTYLILKLTFGLVPIVAGLDKFLNLLTDWSSYISPAVANMLPVSPDAFMMIVGVVEIAAGIIVLTRFTQIGAYIVSAWLLLIAVNLLLAAQFDVAVRDVVMAIAAFSLAQLAAVRQHAGQARPAAERMTTGKPLHA